MAEMNDSTKRKEPEPETEKVEKTEQKAETKPDAEAPKTAVAAKPDEPETKKQKTSSPDAAVVRKQVEYYLSDDNLKFDQFFHDKISANAEGWLELNYVLSCNKMKALKTTKEDVIAALKDSKIEVKDDSLSIRRPANLPLPQLEKRPEKHQKKSVAHAHDGGVIAVIKAIPEEQSWMQIKNALREKLPDKVQLWFVSEVSDKNTCVLASAPFENDVDFFEKLELELAGSKLKAEVAHGDSLQQCLKVLPKHIKDKREKEARKKQKERNRPIVVGQQRFVNVSALRSRVKEILNSRSDGEALKTEGSDYKLIKSLLDFHPKGAEKSKGMVGIKVGKSIQGDSRCFHMVKDDGKEEDFSAQKCLSAIEANPPYVEIDNKDSKKKEGGASNSEVPKVEEKKDDAEKKEMVEEAKKDDAEKKEEVTKTPAAEDKKEEEKKE